MWNVPGFGLTEGPVGLPFEPVPTSADSDLTEQLRFSRAMFFLKSVEFKVKLRLRGFRFRRVHGWWGEMMSPGANFL